MSVQCWRCLSLLLCVLCQRRDAHQSQHTFTHMLIYITFFVCVCVLPVCCVCSCVSDGCCSLYLFVVCWWNRSKMMDRSCHEIGVTPCSSVIVAKCLQNPNDFWTHHKHQREHKQKATKILCIGISIQYMKRSAHQTEVLYVKQYSIWRSINMYMQYYMLIFHIKQK